MTEKITVNVPHKLTKQEACKRINDGFSKVQEQVVGKKVAMQQNWDSDKMSFQAGFMGQSITGTLNVTDKSVLVEIDLPWFLAKLSGGIKDKLQKGTQVLLEKK